MNRLGQKYGKLLVIEAQPRNSRGRVVWKCLCDCGNTAIVSSNALQTKNTKSCGCGKDSCGKRQTADSFWARVNKTDGCWEWQGTCTSAGYGCVSWHGRHYVAHRLAAYLSGMVDSIAAPLSSKTPTHILHKCDNRKCCNPDHFFLGSFSDNQLDAYRKNRRAQPKGECHVNAKLTTAQVAEIRERYKNGELQIPLAKEYGVSQRCISLIVRGETYKCV